MSMKIIFLFASLALLAIISCTEIGPYINLNPDIKDTNLIDTSYVSGQNITATPKKVLISDFTGVRCPNCPKAALKIHELDSMYPGRVVALAYHIKDNPLTTPYFSTADYRTDAATQIYNNLGKSLGLPSGAINQKKYPSETNILVGIDKWISYTQAELTLNSPINITITTKAHPTQLNTYIIQIKSEYSDAVPGKNYLSIAVSESGMVSPQKLPTGEIDSFYTHKHVLRTMLTDPSGMLLMENPEKNRVFIKEFKLVVSSDWNEDDIDIVAYIHKSDTEFDIFQVEQRSLK